MPDQEPIGLENRDARGLLGQNAGQCTLRLRAR